MKRFMLLMLFPIVLLACGDGVNLITTDVVENMAGCYEEMETTDDRYIISLDKHCVDFEIGLPTPTPTTVVSDNPPVAIPTDAEWELIATLQRNPLRPAEFYLFDEDKKALNAAYLAGKHFIFEIGSENRSRQINQMRYYIIQPEPPFQDKDPLQQAHEEKTGARTGKHTYFFPSTGWYVAKEHRSHATGQITSRAATGFFVAFDVFIVKNEEGEEQDISAPQIRLNSSDSFLGDNWIREWVRLRVYVNR